MNWWDNNTSVEGTKDKYAQKRIRTGKTKKDHASGAWQARFANRAARVAWQQDRRATAAMFPGAN